MQRFDENGGADAVGTIEQGVHRGCRLPARLGKGQRRAWAADDHHQRHA
jgi:hypothetical protein